MLYENEIVIDDGNAHLFADKDQLVDGQIMARGLIPRDFDEHPVGYLSYAPPFDLPLIDESEWSARIKEMEQRGELLSQLRLTAGPGDKPIPSLNQGRWGYCWGHSTTSAVTMLRAKMNQPYVPLSAFAVCATIKKGRNQGGFGAQSLAYVRTVGIPSQAIWPQGDADYRKYDTPEMRANAALHKVTEDWADITQPEYSQNLTFKQVMTCLLSGIPVVVDYNWWGHSVCAVDPVEVEAGSFGVRIWNSWSDSWSQLGMGVLRGSKAIPNGAVAPRVTGAAAA